MNADLPLPSTQIARDKTAPTMRFLYPLAAICTAIVFLSPGQSHAQTGGPILRADQQAAIELALRDVEHAMRPMARQQLAITFANFNEAQIAMMVAKISADRAGATTEPVPVEEAETAATAEDRAFMRAQFEPMMRKHHAAQVEFDHFVNSRIAAHCPARDVYARFGSGWRHELGQFMMESALGANRIDDRVNIAGEAYMPKDGRYRFDFSKVRTSFDAGAVEAAIQSACDKVHRIGRSFLAKVDPMIARQDWAGAYKVESAANAALEPIRAELQADYDRLGPGDIGVFQIAMMNGVRVK